MVFRMRCWVLRGVLCERVIWFRGFPERNRGLREL